MNTNYAGFWLRFVAVIIDGIIISVLRAFVIVPILATMGYGLSQELPTDMENPDQIMNLVAMIMAVGGIVTLVSTVIWVLYYTFLESSKMQTSIGKLALGLIVTDENGGKLDFSKALVRNLCKIISGMIMCIGFLMAGFTEKKQGLHDIIAKTLVVKKPAAVATA
jgi:uncharacterized RDD family membrane protein YckC